MSTNGSPTERPRLLVISGDGSSRHSALETFFDVTYAAESERGRPEWWIEISPLSVISEALAGEMAILAAEGHDVVRIRERLGYRGKPLQLPPRIRILRRADPGATDGPEARNSIEAATWDSREAHREALAARLVPHSVLRRIMLFALRAFRYGAVFDPNTLVYLWIESGFDHGPAGFSAPD